MLDLAGGFHLGDPASEILTAQRVLLDTARNLTVVTADRISDRCKTIGAQQCRQLAFDAPREAWPLKDQRRIDLHQRGPGPDLGIGIGSAGHAATANERNALGQTIKPPRHSVDGETKAPG